jgi:hypothetical protein
MNFRAGVEHFRADPGAAWRAFTGSQKDVPFGRLLRERKLNMIFATDDLWDDTRFRDDPEWKAFLSTMTAPVL